MLASTPDPLLIDLLVDGDPAPVSIVNGGGASPILLVCEHAGQAVPAALGDLGVEAGAMERHIAYDLGAADLTRRLAALLDATAVSQPYSRLVVDCNRPPDAPDCAPAVSDGTAVPANAGLGGAGRAERLRAIHVPFHDQIARLLDGRAGAKRATVLVTVHSFTQRLRHGLPRPWHAGLLYNRDATLARALMAHLRRAEPDLNLAFNAPYAVDDAGDYTIPVHGEARSIPHVLVEVRNDLLADPAGRSFWAGRLAHALQGALGDLDVERHRR